MISKKLIIVLCFFIFAIPINTVCQPKTYTLSECISLALKNNLDLKIEKQNINEAKAKLHQTKANRLLQLDFEASYIRFSEVMEADLSENLAGLPFTLPSTTLRFGDEDNYSLKFIISQPLFTGFKLKNNIRATENQLTAAKYDEKVQINNLKFQVTQLYYNFLKAQKFKEVAQLSLNSINAHIQDLQNMYDQGLIKKNELLKAEIKKSEIELMISQAENNISLIENNLLNILGMDLNIEIEINEELIYHPVQDQLLTAYETESLKRPELYQIEYNINALKNLVKSTTSDYYPFLSLIGSYEYGKPGLNKLKNEWMDYWTVGVVAKWNIWDWGIKKNKVAQAKAKLIQLQQTKDKLLNIIQLDVQQALLKKQEAQQRVELSQIVKLQAEENFRLVKDKFHQDMVTNSEFLDAETQFTKSKIDELRAIADYNIAVANLNRAIGNISEK